MLDLLFLFYLVFICLVLVSLNTLTFFLGRKYRNYKNLCLLLSPYPLFFQVTLLPTFEGLDRLPCLDLQVLGLVQVYLNVFLFSISLKSFDLRLFLKLSSSSLYYVMDIFCLINLVFLRSSFCYFRTYFTVRVKSSPLSFLKPWGLRFKWT